MTKTGDDKNQRATEALADIGAAVLNGAISTFLAVVVLLFSSSYVFKILSRQFALTVALGITHGLILLRKYIHVSCIDLPPSTTIPLWPFHSFILAAVLLSLLGPKAFSSAGKEVDEPIDSVKKVDEDTD